MKKTLALATSIAVLAGIWTYIVVTVGTIGTIPFVLWPTFIAWAAFFYAGGTPDGMIKGIIQLFTGAIISWIMMAIYVAIGAPGVLGLAIFVIIIAWPLTALSAFSKWWALVPAGFCGAACYFGVTSVQGAAHTFTWLLATLIPLLSGELLGWLSLWLVNMLMPEKKPAPQPTAHA